MIELVEIISENLEMLTENYYDFRIAVFWHRLIGFLSILGGFGVAISGIMILAKKLDL